MKRWTPIKYREFYDIPRIFLAETENHVFLFDCPFNKEQDEYEKTYKVYLMPAIDEKALAGSWQDLPTRATRLLGEIQTSVVEFDTTFRQQVNLVVLSRFGF
jgi:hypothetical protein